jgi:hypothetical protein
MSRTRRRIPFTPAPPRSATAPAEPMVLSIHAIQRFRERIAPALTFAKARIELRILARTAIRSEDRSASGAEIWRVTDGIPFRLVVTVEGGRSTCLTVVEPDGDLDDEPSEAR